MNNAATITTTTKMKREILLSASLCTVLLVSLLSAGFNTQPATAKSDIDFTTLRSRLSNEFQKHETNHFIILSDADPPVVRHLAGTLEKTHYQFIRTCRRLGLTTKPLTGKFAVMLFAQRSDFRKYALRYDQVAAQWVGGYFANAGNYEVFYAAGQDPGMAQTEAQFRKWNNELVTTQKTAAEARQSGNAVYANQLTKYAEQLTQHINNERKRLNSYSAGQSEARTIHETVHLLAFNMGIQSRYRNAPFWLSEGLATNFETDNSQSAFGPDFDNPIRQNGFRKYLTQNQLLPLPMLLQITDAAQLNREKADILYQESFAFFHWLFRFRRKELAALFRKYEQPANQPGALPAGELSPEKHLHIFQNNIGDPQAIQNRWLRWERAQK